MDEEIKTNAEEGTGPVAPVDPTLEAEQKRDEYLAGWQRAKADFINYKKDEAERMSRMARYATEDIMSELIVVVDNFDLAISTLEKQGEIDKGIHMIRSQLLDMLKKRGLERITIQPGSVFDPATSEAISEIASDLGEGLVVEEVSAGYALHGKVLRPARVKVSSGQKQS